MLLLMKYKFYRLCVRNPASELLQIGHKLEKLQRRHNFPTWCHRQPFFWRCFVFHVKYSYWCKFHVNILTGSGVMTIFFYKGLTRNPEIGYIPVWILPNNWRLCQVRDAKFGTNVSNKMLLIAAKCQGYSSYHFWQIKGRNITPAHPSPPQPHSTQIRVKDSLYTSGLWMHHLRVSLISMYQVCAYIR